MGQDTIVNLGVTVSLPFSIETIGMIRDIYNSKSFSGYISGMYDCEDEIIDIEFHDIMSLENFEKFINYNNYEDSEFKNNLEKYKNLKIFFIYGCCSAYARNISRRAYPHIFHQENDISIDEIIENFNMSRKKLYDLGIPREYIKFGYNFIDSY